MYLVNNNNTEGMILWRDVIKTKKCCVGCCINDGETQWTRQRTNDHIVNAEYWSCIMSDKHLWREIKGDDSRQVEKPISLTSVDY